MADKSITDEEIIKALEGSILNAKWCDSKVRSIEIYKLESVLDLINRQKAEIEELKEKFTLDFEKMESEYDGKIKAEAYKEFAEKLENEINCRTTLSRQQDKNVIHIMHNLLREMVGEEE